MKDRLQYVFLGFVIIVGIILCTVLVIGTQKTPDNTQRKTQKPTETLTAPIVNMPTTACEPHENEIGVVSRINHDAGAVSFYMVDDNVTLDFVISNTTYIYTEHDSPMTFSQVELGDVVLISYDKAQMKLNLIAYKADIKKISRADSISVNQVDHIMSIFQTDYRFTDNTIVAGKDRLMTLMEINSADEFTVYTRNNTVLSLKLNYGHGYLTVTGADIFIGGYLDVGNSIVTTLDEDMMLTVREGTYKVAVSHNGYYGSKTVEIVRDEVATVDFSEIIPDAVEKGNVLFDINVDDAVLTLNGEETDYGDILTLPVGRYNVKLVADGFETYTDTIEVVADYQKIEISMKKSVTETTVASENGTTGSSAIETTTDISSLINGATVVSQINKVYIDEPVGAMIFFDTTYMGVAPIGFPMVTGTHTIIVIDGDSVRSYTVNLAEGGDDVRYSFNE